MRYLKYQMECFLLARNTKYYVFRANRKLTDCHISWIRSNIHKHKHWQINFNQLIPTITEYIKLSQNFQQGFYW